MSTVKLENNKRRNHAEKVLKRMSKNLAPEAGITPEKAGLSAGKSSPEAQLKNQYEVIRKDIMKLRDDLTRGYDLARSYLTQIEPKTLVKDLLKAK